MFFFSSWFFLLFLLLFSFFSSLPPPSLRFFSFLFFSSLPPSLLFFFLPCFFLLFVFFSFQFFYCLPPCSSVFFFFLFFLFFLLLFGFEEDTAVSTSFKRENKSQELLNKGKSVVVTECSNSREQTETAKPVALHHQHHPSWLSSRCLQLLANNNSHDQGEVPGLGSTSRDKIFPSNKEQRWRSKPPASSSNSSHCKLHNRDFSDCLLRHLKSPVQSCHCVKRILEDVLPHIGGK